MQNSTIWMNTKTPNIHPLIDKDKQARAKEYNRKKKVWSFISILTELIVLFVLVFFHVGDTVYNYLKTLTPAIQYLLWAGVLVLGVQLITFVPEYQSGYVIEKDYGFMRQSVGGWLIDLVKGSLIGLVLAFIVLVILGWVVKLAGSWWWMVFAMVLFLLQGLLAMLFPVVILPLFHRYEPIENEILTENLKKILNKAGIEVIGFYREDSSKKTGHDNAFFTGFGKTRRIVLYDNLMDNYTVEEIAGVIAHEAAHRKKRHIVKLLVLNFIITIIISYIINIALLKYYPDFFEGGTYILHSIFFFILMFSILMWFAGMLINTVSRKFEREADTLAINYTGFRNEFVSMLAKLANRNLIDAYPNRWVKYLFMSHPPIGERIDYIEKAKGDKNASSRD